MFEIVAVSREVKGGLGTLRQSGSIPAVLYGPGVKSLSLRVARRDFELAFSEAGESSLLRLHVDDESERKRQHVVLIREVQRDPVYGVPLHVDFHAVRLDEDIRVAVQIRFTGEAPVEERGEGVLVKELREIDIEALPEKLPSEIEVDLSSLGDLGARILVSDIRLPEEVRAVTEADAVIVHAIGLMSEEEESEMMEEGKEVPEGEEVAGEGEEVEAEEKKEGAESAEEEHAERPENTS